MGRVQLLRRGIDSYQRKYDSYAKELEAYNAAGTAFNQGIDRIRAGTEIGLNEPYPGGYETVTGIGGQIQPQGPAEVLPANVATGMAWSHPGETTTSNDQGTSSTPNPERQIFSKNADGSYTQYVPTQGPVNEYGETTMTWQPAGTVQSIKFDKTEPVVDPRIVRGPNLTVGDEQLLQNPTQDQALQVRTQAFGGVPRPELTGDDAPGKNSAFFNLQGDDPKGVAEKGVLARVLAGQL